MKSDTAAKCNRRNESYTGQAGREGPREGGSPVQDVQEHIPITQKEYSNSSLNYLETKINTTLNTTACHSSPVEKCVCCFLTSIRAGWRATGVLAHQLTEFPMTKHFTKPCDRPAVSRCTHAKFLPTFSASPCRGTTCCSATTGRTFCTSFI